MDRFLFRRDPHEGHDRTEDLLGHDGHRVVAVAENRRLEELSGPADALAAAAQLGALANRVPDELLCDLELVGENDGADVDVLAARIALAKPFGELDDAIEEPIVNVAVS